MFWGSAAPLDLRGRGGVSLAALLAEPTSGTRLLVCLTRPAAIASLAAGATAIRCFLAYGGSVQVTVNPRALSIMLPMNETARKLYNEVRLSCAGAVARILPSSRGIVANKIVFSSFGGAGFGCNPKYIAQALLRLSPRPLDLVWIARKRDRALPDAVRHVPWGSVAAAREWATARVWVDNVRTRRHVAKKPGQFYVQTWHGTLTPKRLEAAVAGLSHAYVAGAQQDSRDADCFLSNNDTFDAMVRSSFWYDGPIMRCGYPRNAVLVNPQQEVRERVRRALGVADEARICLYAPTFRDHDAWGIPPLDHERCCSVLEQRFGAPFVWVLRAHPNVARALARDHAADVVNASWYGDAVELLVAADVLITDYSSMAEDFALLGRPGYQFVPDAREYERTRGFAYPLSFRPFPVAYTHDELCHAILNTSEEEFRTRAQEFFAAVGLVDDGKGDEAVARMLLDVLDAGE